MTTRPFNIKDNDPAYVAPRYSPTMPCVGTAIPGDGVLDPDNLMNYNTGLNLASKNYAPKKPFRAICIQGGESGQTNVVVKARTLNGSIFQRTFSVAAGEERTYERIFIGIYGNGDTTAALVEPGF